MADSELLQELARQGKPAMLAIRVSIQRAFFQCARSILRAQIWKPETWQQPRKISFGRIVGQNEEMRKQIDVMVDQSCAL